MRDAFVVALTEAIEHDPSIMLLTADLGFGVLTDLAERYPENYLNVGVAEQNMTGIAAGLAMSGRKVFTYSIANFPTLRCLEQIRNDICYHDLDVTVVAIGGGLSYGALGFSHQATEDLAILRALPNMTVVAPGHDDEAAQATRALLEHRGPSYLRLDRASAPPSGVALPDFELGRLQPLAEVDADVLLLTTGAMLTTTVDAAAQLRKNGVSALVANCPTLKPFDAGGLHDLVGRGSRLVVTVEEHSMIGGLGSAVAEELAGSLRARPPVLRIGLPDTLPSLVGSQEYLREHFGLTSPAISDVTLRTLRRIDEDG